MNGRIPPQGNTGPARPKPVANYLMFLAVLEDERLRLNDAADDLERVDPSAEPTREPAVMARVKPLPAARVLSVG